MMTESLLSRLWNFVKPPASVKPKPSLEALRHRRRQRKLIMITLGALSVVAAGVAVVAYIESAPQRADKEFQEGMKLMRPGGYPDAIARLTRALQITPQRPEFYLERGNAHRSLGETDAALADFQWAVDLNPNLADAHNGIAMIFIERQDTRRALEELNKSIAIQPTIDAYYQRGLILEAQGEHQKAINDYDQAIAVARDAPYMYRARAMAKESLGDKEGAHADRDTATQIESR